MVVVVVVLLLLLALCETLRHSCGTDERKMAVFVVKLRDHNMASTPFPSSHGAPHRTALLLAST